MYRVTSNISNVYKIAVGIDNDLAPKANELILFLSMLLDMGRRG